MHAAAVENHSGFYDTDNPGFSEQADAALATAMDLARRVKSPAGRVAAIEAYSAAYHDGHFVTWVEDKEDIQQNWAGHMMAWRDGRALVHTSEDKLLIGAELLACDGRSAESMMREDVFTFHIAKPDQDAYWALRAPQLLVSDGNPFVARPNECQFALPDGKTEIRTMDWQPVPDDFQTRSREAVFGGVTRETRLREIAPNQFYIDVPDFAPDAAEVEQLNTLIATLEAQQAELRKADLIIIDTRGNRGGNSAWGDGVVHAIWGEDYVESREQRTSAHVDWRASSGNLEYIQSFEEILKAQGLEEIWDDWAATVVTGMEEALANGQPLYRVPGKVNAAYGTVTNPVSAEVVFITDGGCASSCLDLADTMLSLEGVTHAGYPTSSDTVYLELRKIASNDSKVGLALPIKTYVNRLRANDEFYEPEWRYEGLDWSDNTIQEWMLDQVASA